MNCEASGFKAREADQQARCFGVVFESEFAILDDGYCYDSMLIREVRASPFSSPVIFLVRVFISVN